MRSNPSAVSTEVSRALSLFRRKSAALADRLCCRSFTNTVIARVPQLRAPRQDIDLARAVPHRGSSALPLCVARQSISDLEPIQLFLGEDMKGWLRRLRIGQ